MKKFKCEDIMCGGCVARIEKALTAAGIEHKVNLEEKTVMIEGSDSVASKAVELLDDLGYGAVEMSE